MLSYGPAMVMNKLRFRISYNGQVPNRHS